MNSISNRAWAKVPKAANGAHLRLFCFPYAGARSYAFREWIGALPGGIAVCPVLLPGENFHECCVSSMEELLATMAAGIRPYLDRPFAFFGHSMGSIIAFELLRFLQRDCGIAAVHLFVSARIAPGLACKTLLHNLPQAELIAQLKTLNGTPPEILENEEVLEVLLPRLRADFQLNETYFYRPGSPLTCPITAFCGTKDVHATPEEMLPWECCTAASFTLRSITGDHFFLHARQPELLENISAVLLPHLEHMHS